MLQVRHAAVILALLAPAAYSQSQADHRVILRSGHVTMCELEKGCSEEVIADRKYLVIKSDGFVLKVASGEDQKHGFADVIITNETGTQQQVNPANFRMEESRPRLHRLFYLDPDRRQAAVEERPEPRPAKEQAPRGLPPPEYWTSPEHQQDKQERIAKALTLVPPPTVNMLHAGAIAPDGTVTGRVYFEKPRSSEGVSVLLALPGALFEFPCNLVPERKVKKHKNHDRSQPDEEARS